MLTTENFVKKYEWTLSMNGKSHVTVGMYPRKKTVYWMKEKQR